MGVTSRNMLGRIGKLFSVKPLLTVAVMLFVYHLGRVSSPCYEREPEVFSKAFRDRSPMHLNRDIQMDKEQSRSEILTEKERSKDIIGPVVYPQNDFPKDAATKTLSPLKVGDLVPAVKPLKEVNPPTEPGKAVPAQGSNKVISADALLKTLLPKVLPDALPKALPNPPANPVPNFTLRPISVNRSRLYLPKDYYGTGSVAHHDGLRRMGVESVSKHSFKSPFIVDPHIYSRSTIRRPPGQRQLKTISCYNCPERFYISHKYNNDFQQCPYSECRLTKTSGMNNDASVMIFWQDPETNPPPKPKGQVWVYMSWETPPHRSHPKPDNLWLNKFNWTISYRLDADFVLPYDMMYWRDRSLLQSDDFYLKMAKGKTKMATWWVSHCETRSHREQYVRELQKYIEVDVYGECGNLTCERNLHGDCYSSLNDTYRFYLSFENSFCHDYVTEKFFKMFRQRFNIIPVVRSAFDYQKYLPPNILIDAQKFISPEALANHLKALAKDDVTYAQMLKEKDKLGILNRKIDWCDFCEKLHTGKFKKRVIGNVKDFTNEAGHCWDRVIKEKKKVTPAPMH